MTFRTFILVAICHLFVSSALVASAQTQKTASPMFASCDIEWAGPIMFIRSVYPDSTSGDPSVAFYTRVRGKYDLRSTLSTDLFLGIHDAIISRENGLDSRCQVRILPQSPRDGTKARKLEIIFSDCERTDFLLEKNQSLSCTSNTTFLM